MRNTTFVQTECAYLELVNAKCSKNDMTLPLMAALIPISFTTFMAFYTVVDYLARRIDKVIGVPEGKKMSKYRRCLLKIRASPIFSSVFWMLLLLQLLGTFVCVVTNLLYLVLGTCVAPQRLIPILLAVVAVAYVAKTTFEGLKKLQQALAAKVDELCGSVVDDAEELDGAIEDALMELGYNETQIIGMTLGICAAFLCFVAFILIGCSLFVHPSTIIPTLISSAMVGLSTIATVASGKVPSKYANNSGITASIGKNIRVANDFTVDANKFVGAKDLKSGLQGAAVVNADLTGKDKPKFATVKKKAKPAAKPTTAAAKPTKPSKVTPA